MFIAGIWRNEGGAGTAETREQCWDHHGLEVARGTFLNEEVGCILAHASLEYALYFFSFFIKLMVANCISTACIYI